MRRRLDSMEARLSSDKPAENDGQAKGVSDGETVGSYDPNDGQAKDDEVAVCFDPDDSKLVLNVVEKLSDYNYLKWSRSIHLQLESIKLHIFLRFTPKKNERAIHYDQLVKESILATITPQAVARISLLSFPHTKQLWTIIRKLFYEDLLSRIEPNITYLTRTEVRTLDDVKMHVERFRIAAGELRAIDYVFSENVLIELFLNSLAKELALFRSMMRKHISELGLNYEHSLRHAETQSYFFVRISSGWPDSRDSEDSQTTLLGE